MGLAPRIPRPIKQNESHLSEYPKKREESKLPDATLRPSFIQLRPSKGEQLIVDERFYDLLQENHLTTFKSLNALQNKSNKQIFSKLIKQTNSHRSTHQIQLISQHQKSFENFYLKWHARPKLSERLKPFFQLKTPHFGARPEWNALHLFNDEKINVPTPVALAQKGNESILLMTEVPAQTKLSDWFQNHSIQDHKSQRQLLIKQIAKIAKKMHAAKLHHQDFYLGHFLISENANKSVSRETFLLKSDSQSLNRAAARTKSPRDVSRETLLLESDSQSFNRAAARTESPRDVSILQPSDSSYQVSPRRFT